MLLQELQSPSDLRQISRAELPVLAAEIRLELEHRVMQNGGHLASNLGVVELSIALHRHFSSPQDAIVWDVSHQCYTHKLLTGRFAHFASLRQSGGIAGFTSPAESEHDYFFAGHAGTSVGSALGLAEARRLQGNPHTCVAVLGDGALTCGSIYEALNNAGHSGAKLIIVLNDNEMSIGRNVGGLSRYLAAMRSRPGYRLTKQRVERTLLKIPKIGFSLARWLASTKNRIKRLLLGTTLFEDMGLDYIGPIDGHSFDALAAALESAKLSPRPVLVHVRTIKGKGCRNAEAAPESFHGITAVAPPQPEASFCDCFAEWLCEAAKANPNLVAVTAAMAHGTGLDAMATLYPTRVFDVGIAEAHAITFASGLAKQGMHPVVALYATFLQRSYDQLLHDIALQGLPLTVVVSHAGFVGEDGATHHGLYDLPMCAAIPGAIVFSPATQQDLTLALGLAQQAGRLVFVRYPKGAALPWRAPPVLQSSSFALFGQGTRVIVTYGQLVHQALQVPGVRVLQLRRVLPISARAVQCVQDATQIDFYEEGQLCGGVAERFGLLLLQANFAGVYRCFGVNGFARHAPIEELLRDYGLHAEAMQCG